MTGDHNRTLKWQRYEAKYLISEAQAAEIGRWCRDHLPPDPYARSEAGYEYPILSTYLDSPSRQLLRHTLNRQMSRYKLRVRTYRGCNEAASDLPAYFEIKRKVNGIVHKTRARIEPEDAESLLWTEQGLLTSGPRCDADTWTNVSEFQQLRGRLRAKPVVGVFYMREAYEGVSAERTRITLDRSMHYGVFGTSGIGRQEMWWPVETGSVILEIKFTNTYPFWVADMLGHVEVMRRGVCKYVICSQAAGVCEPGSGPG